LSAFGGLFLWRWKRTKKQRQNFSF